MCVYWEGEGKLSHDPDYPDLPKGHAQGGSSCLKHQKQEEAQLGSTRDLGSCFHIWL